MISYTFSGRYFQQALKEVTELMYKKIGKLKEKATNQLEEIFLKYEKKK